MSDIATSASVASVPQVDEVQQPRAGTERRVDWPTLVVLAVPAVLVLAAAWSHRWTTDDGFINVRIVDQIFDGNGPVFNAGERVEAGTSPAWILLSVVGRVVSFGLPTEWVAVVLGIGATTLAVVVAEMTAMRLYRARVMPFGIIAFIALPGRAFAGTVTSVGEGVTELHPGDAVYGTCDDSFAEYVVAEWG